MIEMGTARTLQIVANTRAIRFWIRGRVDAGWTDEQIATVLPHAATFITGRMTEAKLREMFERATR